MRRLIGAVFAFFIIASLHGQSNSQVSWYSADNDYLPQNSVKSIAKDKYGYIWLSTENGVVRYDGANFNVYNTASIKGLASDRMITFYGSATTDSICINNENKETLLIKGHQISKLLPQKTVSQFKIKKPFYVLYEETVIGKHFSKKNEFFKLLSSNGYYIIGNDSIRSYKSNGKMAWKQAYQYPESSQFFTVGDKLFLMSKHNQYVEFFPGASKIKNFGQEISGGVIYTNPVARQTFIYSGGAIYHLKVQGGKLIPEIILEGFNFPENNIISVYYDISEKIIYAGSYSKGLAVVRPNDFSASTGKGSDGMYYAISPFGKDSVLTSTGDIFGSDGYKATLNFGKKTDKYMLLLDNDGNIWTKEYRTLYCFTKSSRFKESRSWLLPDRITTIGAGPDARILISTQTSRNSGQLYYIETNQTSARPAFYLKVPFVINCMDFTIPGKLYLGSERGLHELELTTRNYRDIYTAPDVYVRSIYIKSKNEIWATTYNKGFFLYKNGTITRFPIDRNNYLHASHCIAEDKQGNFWIPTNRGLFQMKRDELLNFAAKKSSTVYYHYYDKYAGFLSNEFNGGCQPCTAKLSNGSIYFPSLNGVIRFNPSEIRPSLPKSKLFVDAADVDGAAIPRTDTIRLQRDFNRIRFLVTSPYFGNPYNQQIESNLSGPVEQKWAPLSGGQVSFSRLPPGEYLLTLRKNTGFGSQFEYLRIVMLVPSPFWQTTWFYAGALILIAALVYFFTGIRMRYVKYKNILLERKIELQTRQLQDTITTLKSTKVDLNRQVKTHKKLLKTIAHDIKSPLRFINLTGRFIYQDASSSSIKNEVEAIYTSSEQLYHFVDNFLENAKSGETGSKSEPYALKSLIDEKITFFKAIARSKNIALDNAIVDDFLITANRHLLSIILHNLLDNAIKNTTSGTVTYSSSADSKMMQIILRDTGKGMAASKIQHYHRLVQGDGLPDEPMAEGVGLSIVIDLLHVMGGSLQIQSSGSGTVIVVTLPYRA